MMRFLQGSVAAVCSIASLLTVAPASAAERVTLMAYNVENFFDAADDPRMPNGSNSEVINAQAWVDAKAAAVARVISRFDQGTGPDILVLSEVESLSALEAIRAALPNPGAYVTAALMDADPNRPPPKPDRRGIKVGLLAKFPVVAGSAPSSHPVNLTGLPECRDSDGAPGSTRDLLKVDLVLPDGSEATVIGGHLPSGRNPRVCRETAAKAVNALVSTLPAERVVIAAGDFNFNCAPDEQAGLRTALPEWAIPSQIDNACRGFGTQYFGREKTWSYLDLIAQRVPQGAQPKWKVDLRTFRPVLDDFEQLFWDQNDNVLRPKAFRFNQSTGKGSGTSDHWPVAMDLVRN